MKTPAVFLEKFRRITSAGSYLPELDGLRFLAIFWVFAMMHTSNFVNVKFYGSSLFSPYIYRVLLEGVFGVSFFFIISGFILAVPFARQYQQQGKKIILKQYYLRRLTRLEPPYFAALLIAFAGLIFWKQESVPEQLPHLAASAAYVHGFVYGTKSSILGIAWSLELEAQFYVLAPFFALLYRIRNETLRRGIFIFLIIFFTAISYRYMWVGTYRIYKSPQCFFIGMLLCDLYINKVSLPGKSKFWLMTAIIIAVFIPFLVSLYDFPSYLIKHLLLALLFYIGVTIPEMKKILSIQWISIIGGMCYSIYLLQFIILSGTAPLLRTLHIANAWLGFPVYALILIIFVLAGSIIFYRFIEQPCMRRDWSRSLFTKKKVLS